jgi:hypothetical protein
MTVITSKYRSDTSRLFVDDTLVNDYYLFASSTSSISVDNTNASKRDFLEKTLFGKRIDPDEVFFMIKNNRWTTNLIYDQYDDTVDLSQKSFYAVVYPEDNETGDYRIYKCLFNNYGAESLTPPNYSENTPNQEYSMPDGYVWKFMYSLSVLEFEKYNTRGYIPLPKPANTEVITVYTEENTTSSIDQIFVTNPTTNRGYETITGLISGINRDNGRIVISGDPTTFNVIENYYTGYSFYVTANTNSQVYEINTYEYNSNDGTATITLVGGAPSDGVLVNLATFQVLPRIVIRGDGDGAIAIPRVSVNGMINRVIVLNGGEGYTNAIAFIPDPFGFDPVSLESLDERVSLRPVISPIGGHGTNLIDELSCRHVLSFVELTETDNQVVPDTNRFASIGIVKNPRFKTLQYPDVFDNRIELLLDEHALSVNEIVTQIETANTSSDFFNEIRFAGKVHAISNNTIYISEYVGPYPNDVDDSQPAYANTDFSDISLKIELPLLSSQNQVLAINTDNGPGFEISDYIQRSGEVYYMTNFDPITRTPSSREQFKIILEF